MRRDAVLAAGLLFGALLACRSGPSATDWTAHSVNAAHERLTKNAIEVGGGDLEDIRQAGGAFLGTLTMDEGTSGDSMDKAVAREAANRGGTHYLASGSTTETTHAGAWTLKDRKPRFRVYRVPLHGWSSLPPSLTPEPK